MSGLLGRALQDAAMSVLHYAGLVTRIAWKPPQTKTGYAPMYVVKNYRFADKLAELKMGNFLNDILGLGWGDCKSRSDGEHHHILEKHPNLLPELNTIKVQSFVSQWQSALNNAAASTAGQSPPAATSTGAAAAPAAKDMKMHNASHIKWVCGKTGEKKIKRAYIKNRIPGFNDETDWDPLTAVLCALCIATETGPRTAPSQGVIELLRPADDALCQQVTEAVCEKFEIVEEKATELFRKKFLMCNHNTNFEMDTFHAVLKEL